MRSITHSRSDGPIDWELVATASKGVTPRGTLDLDDTARAQYRSDVLAARDRVRDVTENEFRLPPRIEIHHRHHWIDANLETFERLFSPVATQHPAATSPPVRFLNTGAMGVTMSLLARNVLGQYDPILLADESDHAMYFVDPNIRRISELLDVPLDRFRRWIAFHEVTHAAEFAIAPWLGNHLESHVRSMVETMAHGRIDRGSFRALNATMTAVEGYAEFVMDAAFDEDPTELREKLDERRRQLGPARWLLDRLLGLQIKRRQYEQGKEFFEQVVEAYGIETANTVWQSPEHLPSYEEIDHPHDWVTRIDSGTDSSTET